jgi:hypothetical protein
MVGAGLWIAPGTMGYSLVKLPFCVLDSVALAEGVSDRFRALRRASWRIRR